MRKTIGILVIGASCSWMSWSATAATEGENLQPYIDSIRQKLRPEEKTSAGYTEKLRQQMGPSSEDDSAGYSEKLRERDRQRNRPESSVGYTENEKSRIEKKDDSGAISAYYAGKELELKRPGKINHAFTIHLQASQTRKVTDNFSGHTLSNFYGDKWVPDITVAYEFQPFHSEWFGNVGIVMGGGISFQNALGAFKVRLTDPATGALFPANSKTRFHFYSIPIFAGLNYRFNLFRVLRPYVQATPTLIGYWEDRSDSRSGFRGNSRGVILSGGVNILLDWISDRSSWNLYEEQGVKHYYLTVDYSNLSTFSGDVKFALSGFSGGLTFEF